MAAMKILGSYPDFGKLKPEYVVSIVELLETYSLADIHRLAHPRSGIVAQCQYPPTAAQIVDFIEGPAIHKWANGTMHRTRQWVVPETVTYGPNFTQQRLAREAEREKLGLPPEPEFKSRERYEPFIDDTPHWIKNPDPDAPWRKQGPPSQELIDDCRKHGIEVAAAVKATEDDP